MQPSLPVSWFDFCLVPDHDQPAPATNVIITRGAINSVQPSREHDDKSGLILVGGPSRHFSWNEQEILDQIRAILIHDGSVSWQISDSPRTPTHTSDALARFDFTNMTFHSWQHTGSDWVASQLARAGRAWISSDSMSMIYETLTSGAAIGVLSVPEKTPGRLTRAIKALITDGIVTAFSDWDKGRPLSTPPYVFDEPTRCAALLLENIDRDQHQRDR